MGKCIADSLPLCEVVLNFDAGNGDCENYKRGTLGFFRCWGDEDRGYTAFEVCPECMRCQVTDLPPPRALPPADVKLRQFGWDEIGEDLALLEVMIEEETKHRENKRLNKRKKRRKRRYKRHEEW